MSWITALAFFAAASVGGALAFWIAHVGAHAVGKFTGWQTILVRAGEFGAAFVVIFMILFMLLQSFFYSWVAATISTLGLTLAALAGAFAVFLGGLAGSVTFVLLVLPVVLVLPKKHEP